MGTPNDSAYQMIDLSSTPLHTRLSKLIDMAEKTKHGTKITIRAANPDNCSDCYGGERYKYDDQTYCHHGWHSWSSLAHLLKCRMLTPVPAEDGTVKIAFQKLDISNSFHLEKGYDTHNTFARTNKLEEPDFVYYYLQALEEVQIKHRKRLLDLGMHDGSELVFVEDMLPKGSISMTGIEIEQSALKQAATRLPQHTFYRHDINKIQDLCLGRFDLILSIATLQSPSVDTKPLVMDLIQNHLTDRGAVIFAFPNSRWIDGELIQGAKAPNYPFSELSLVLKDLYWIKKYLQQHKFRVRIFGSSYLFLVATRIHAAF
jgi:2-polyprenyl-3-methyl-5-hydroxy-6-metoxy-1,4-benzoquinol methylase